MSPIGVARLVNVAVPRQCRVRAAANSKIVFSTADKNGDGYLDNSEYTQRDMSHESKPNSTDPASDTVTPR